MNTTRQETCGLSECTAPATRQQYANTPPESFAANPWGADQYDLRCRQHASAQSWPLELSEDIR